MAKVIKLNSPLNLHKKLIKLVVLIFVGNNISKSSGNSHFEQINTSLVAVIKTNNIKENTSSKNIKYIKLILA